MAQDRGHKSMDDEAGRAKRRGFRRGRKRIVCEAVMATSYVNSHPHPAEPRSNQLGL
jgi:hypothetical protein